MYVCVSLVLKVPAHAHGSALPHPTGPAGGAGLQAAAHLQPRCLSRHVLTDAARNHGESRDLETGSDVATLPQTPELCLLLFQVLMINARRIYRRTVTSCGYLGSQQRATFRLMDRRMLLYPLVFFFCWGPGGGSVWWAGGVCECVVCVYVFLTESVCLPPSGGVGIAPGGGAFIGSGCHWRRPLRLTGWFEPGLSVHFIEVAHTTQIHCKVF